MNSQVSYFLTTPTPTSLLLLRRQRRRLSPFSLTWNQFMPFPPPPLLYCSFLPPFSSLIFLPNTHMSTTSTCSQAVGKKEREGGKQRQTAAGFSKSYPTGEKIVCVCVCAEERILLLPVAVLPLPLLQPPCPSCARRSPSHFLHSLSHRRTAVQYYLQPLFPDFTQAKQHTSVCVSHHSETGTMI